MEKNNRTECTRVEELLRLTHRDLAILQQRRQTLLRSGIQSELLPDELALMAFAALGDHERHELLTSLQGRWSGYQAKGLVNGSIESATTAELRLISHAGKHADIVDNVWERLRDCTEVKEPPRSVWRSARRVRGPWGQVVRVHFTIQHVSYILIEPDPVFGLQSAFLAGDPKGRQTGVFVVPIDDGAIRITMLHSNGEIYRQVVTAILEEVRDVA